MKTPPQKCPQLEDVVVELKECLSIEDGGTRPIRASGSRWIGHIQNVSYVSMVHIPALSDDPSVKSADKAKLGRKY